MIRRDLRNLLFCGLFLLGSSCDERFVAGSLVDGSMSPDLVGTHCPTDRTAAIGTACTVAGETCGVCANPCDACDAIVCGGGVWSHDNSGAGICSDGGVVVLDSGVAMTSACSPACGAQQVCIVFGSGVFSADAGSTPTPMCMNLPAPCSNTSACSCLSTAGNTGVCTTMCIEKTGYLECLGA